ncbi:hypothetical protein [Rhizobium leguminosarum]|uniref:hypothetical protein n=1 Tax=Rhizobium leguminosarum TaxID=384 RepID=UPI001C947692|nr:hypothetical protein [Rhizobium leguminosarum]
MVNHPHIDGAALEATITDGFGIDKTGEVRFDAAVGLLGMLDVVEGHRAEGSPDDEDVTTWEGWIFGQRA